MIDSRRILLAIDPGSEGKRADEGLVEVCCEDLEIALEAGVMKASILGQLYINVVRNERERYWAIEYCCFCGHRRSEPVVRHQKARGRGRPRKEK